MLRKEEPRANIQAPENIQSSNIKFGCWGLEFLWCLELDIWSFSFARWPYFSGGIEARREDANQCLFTMAGGFLRTAFVPFDARDAMQKTDHPVRKALGIGNAIAGESLAQIADTIPILAPALSFPPAIKAMGFYIP
jgi:hypothetical protein